MTDELWVHASANLKIVSMPSLDFPSGSFIFFQKILCRNLGLGKQSLVEEVRCPKLPVKGSQCAQSPATRLQSLGHWLLCTAEFLGARHCLSTSWGPRGSPSVLHSNPRQR